MPLEAKVVVYSLVMEDMEVTLQGLGFTQLEPVVIEGLLNLEEESEVPFLNIPSPSEFLYWTHKHHSIMQKVLENSGLVAGGENGKVVEKHGGLNHSFDAPRTSIVKLPSSGVATTPRTSRCFDGITWQELGLEENRASNSDGNHQAESEQHPLTTTHRSGGGKPKCSMVREMGATSGFRGGY